MSHSRLLTLACALTLMSLLWGCQTPAGSTQASVDCPACQAEAKSMPTKGLKHTKHICPTCKKVEVLDTYGENPHLVVDTAHYCARCDGVVVECEACAGR